MPNETGDSESLFPLVGNIERPLIVEIVKTVRSMFRRDDITTEQMHHLAVLLYGLERLPLATQGIDVTLTLSYRSETDMSYQSVDLDGSTFELSSGGSVYDPSVGSDTFGDNVLMVETTGYREAKQMAMVEWLMGFKERAREADIRVDLDEACEVEWDAEPDESAWERATTRYADEEDDDE